MTETNLAFDFCPFNSKRTFSIFFSSVCSLEYLAEYTPGLPSSRSTLNPLSSEIAVLPEYLHIVRALINAFSSNVVPSSTISSV